MTGLAVAGASAAACTPDRKTAPATVTAAPALARTTVDVHSRAQLVWADAVDVNGAPTPAGIRGDGRDRFGQPAATLGEYQGNHCGVHAFFFDQKGEPGQLESDPDTRYDAATMAGPCGAARAMAFYLAGPAAAPTAASPHVVVRDLWAFAPGEVRLQPQTFGMQRVTCQLQFNARYAGASNVRVTRLPDATSDGGAVVRQWRVESQGNHTAACLELQANGKLVDTKIRYVLPFAVTITQVPYPHPVFPA